MIGGGGFVQRATAMRVACVDPRLVTQQQLHAGGIVFVTGRSRQECRLPAVDFGMRAPL